MEKELSAYTNVYITTYILLTAASVDLRHGTDHIGNYIEQFEQTR
jgi:hypothetical protein